jgi:hypothetical protein
MKRLLALTMLAGAVFGYVQETKPMRVLFIGNSYTYYNNLPELVAGLAASAGVKMETHMIARGGATLEQIWDMDDVRQVLHEGKWDYVVLQEHSQLGTLYVDGVQELSEPEHFWETIRTYDSEIRRIRAKTILYLTWARKSDPAQQPALNYAYMTIAQELGLTVAPVGMAWARVREAEPYMALHLADGSHPTPSGSYLAACVLADTILARRLSTLPAKVAGHPISRLERVDMSRTADLVNLPVERAEWLQRIAGEVHQHVAEAGGWIPTAKPPPQTFAKIPLPAGRKPAPKDLSGVWKGKMSFYTWPSTMELKLNAPDADHCAGQWSVTSQTGDHKLAGPIESCRMTDTGIAFLVRDYRGLTMSESYWAHYTGDSLVGLVEYRGMTNSARMSGSWELHKEH